ncbi:MAG: hypothetical protein KatS3mg123_0221 [Burkholderiales bacterium]|nr:MAG: hypothetical protein KatS3mg123_0221 [Burkholderiales bacterium]
MSLPEPAPTAPDAHYRFALQFFEAIGRVEKAKRRRDDRERLARLRAHSQYAAAFDAPAPLISVIIPTYNRARIILERTLPSVLRQEYPHWELIIVGDGADPDSARLLAGIEDPRVRFVNLRRRGRYPELAGPRWYVAGCKPANVGLALARGQWIAHLDDDDEFFPQHLGDLLELARQRRVEWVHSEVEFIRGNGRPNVRVGGEIPALGHIARISSLYHAGLKSFHYNGASWKYFYPADWDLWERFLEMGVTHAHLPRVTAVHHGPLSRFAEEGLTSTPSEPTKVRDDAHAYTRWCAHKRLRLIHGQVYAERMMLRWRSRPTLHVVVHARHGEEELLADTLDSLSTQLYRQLELTVMAEFPAPAAEGPVAAGVRWISPDAPLFAVAPPPEDWIVCLPAGAQLAPHALFSIADYADAHPRWRLIYWDDDRIDPGGNRLNPRFKPDFNLDLARSMPYAGPGIAVRADAFAEVSPAHDYDLLLQILDRYEEEAIGHIADVLLSLPSKLEAGLHTPSTRAALTRHLHRRGIQAELADGFIPGTVRVIYHHPDRPLVSIIIPTKDKLEFLQPCVESLFAKTTYPHYEVILCDNGSSDPDVLAYYETLEEKHGERVRLLSYPYPFNFAAMCNAAAKEARGEYLLFLNNDTQIVQPEWLERMMLHGMRPDVGVVGCRLVYPESAALQHAGIVLGLTDIAHHAFSDGKTSLSDSGYMNRAQVDQNYSAVTAACMLVRRNVYLNAGGMDQENLAVLFNDVDFCLRLAKQGYRVVWTPFATVVHHGSTSIHDERRDLKKLALAAERAEKERLWMLSRWLPRLARDPAYNRNLALTALDFRVEAGAVPEWDPEFHDRPRVLGLPLAGGSGEYRIRGPFRALSDAGLAQCTAIDPPGLMQARVLSLIEMERLAPDTLVLHAAINDAYLQALELYSRFLPRMLRVMSLDDLITQLPPKNAFYRFAFKDAKPRLRRAAALCQRLIVSTEPLRELTRSMCDDVRVVPNRLESDRWLGLHSARRAGRKPRVGWAGAQQHQGDLELIYDVVRATAQEAEWVFFGMCPEALRPYVHEFHEFVSFDEYPAKLASLNLDLAIAPLELNAFNEAKSNLRLLEYGVLGWPVVCTDIYPYQGAPVTRLSNEPRVWIEAIRERIHNLDAAAQEGDRLREWVLASYLLENSLEEWLDALTDRAPVQARPCALALP